MNSNENTTVIVDSLLQRLAAGDSAAREQLLIHCSGRMERLAHGLLRGSFARLHAVEQTQDVAQDAFARLLTGWECVIHRKDGSLRTDVGEFLSCSAQLVRQTLLDLCRKHFGRTRNRPKVTSRDVEAEGDTNHARHDPANDTLDPSPIALFTEFHEAVERLDEHLRRVVDLHWYQELTHQEVANLLGISEATSRKYWTQARLQLAKKFQGNPFDWFQ